LSKIVGNLRWKASGWIQTQGGYSNVLVVDENYALRMPKNLPLDAAAPLLCAGITTYSPLKLWEAGPGKHVAILGLGGLGHIGVKIAKAMGAKVTVLSQSLKKKDDAIRLGADQFFATSDPETFKTQASTFDLILNTVSADIEYNQYIRLLKVGGAIVALGIPEKMDVPVSIGALIMGRRNVTGSIIGSISETQEMLDFCSEHTIVCDIEKIPIQKINEAYDRVVSSDVRYRFVIDMSSLDTK